MFDPPDTPMYPVFLSEDIVRIFTFYQDGSLYQGLVSKHKFFKLVREFNALERGDAFNLALGFERQRSATIITASGACYKVWVDVSANVTCVKTTLFADEMQISSLSSPEDRAFSSTADVA
ncbi:MAG: hypothetical protein AAFU78_02610 [Cyanobacteria bacterium J06633_2]